MNLLANTKFDLHFWEIATFKGSILRTLEKNNIQSALYYINPLKPGTLPFKSSLRAGSRMRDERGARSSSLVLTVYKMILIIGKHNNGDCVIAALDNKPILFQVNLVLFTLDYKLLILLCYAVYNIVLISRIFWCDCCEHVHSHSIQTKVLFITVN